MKFSQSFYQLAKRAVKPEVGKLKFNFKKHFIQNPPDLKVYSMEALGHPGDHRFGYTDSFKLLDDEACDYILALTKNEEYLKKTKYVTDFSPFVLRNCCAHDQFLHDWYYSEETEKYFSDIIGEEIRWLSNTWGGSHINVQANEGLDTKIFDWHVDSQPLTLIINVSDMPEHVIGGSTILRKYDDGSEIELKQPAKGYATLFRGTAVFHKGSAANYERVIYVKTLEFKDVSIMNKSDALFSAHYSDIADSFSQDLQYKFRRLSEQIEFMRDNPEKANEIVELVKEEIKHCQIFAKYAFHIQDGRMQVEDLVEKNLIQNVYTKNG